ncbi:MAG: hypothetical protein V4736_09385 [Bdellovibrionota bacterium]
MRSLNLLVLSACISMQATAQQPSEPIQINEIETEEIQFIQPIEIDDTLRIERVESFELTKDILITLKDLEASIRVTALEDASNKYNVDKDLYLALLELSDAATASENKKKWDSMDWNKAIFQGYRPQRFIEQKSRGFRVVVFEVVSSNGQIDQSKPIVYAFAATQLYGVMRSLKDWTANIGYGIPQTNSSASMKVIDELIGDLKGRKVILTGQSLGGMVSHGIAYAAITRIINQNPELSGNFENAGTSPIRSITFGIPGMVDTLPIILKGTNKKKRWNLIKVPELENFGAFESYFYAPDLLPRLGTHFGNNRELKLSLIKLEDGENYCMNIPLIRDALERHLKCGFARAFRKGVEFEENTFKRKQIKIPKFLLRLNAGITTGLLDLSTMFSNKVNSQAFETNVTAPTPVSQTPATATQAPDKTN